MSHLTRKEIKRDEFANVMGRGVEYAESHARSILLAIGGALLLSALAAGVYFWLGSRAEQANTALAKAMKVYKAPVVATGAKPDDPAQPSFATEAARRERAEQLFRQVGEDYGSADAADVAAVYLAQLAVAKGDLARARELWSDFLDEHEGHMLAREVRLNLIYLDRQQGKGQELVASLKRMLDEGEAPLPQDVVLYELGQTYEQLQRKQEAIDTYRRITQEFPQSLYGQDARQRLAALDPAQAAGPAGALGAPGALGL